MDISNLKRDIATIDNGEWVGDIPNMGALRLKVRGSSSKVYTTKLSRLTRAAPREDRDRGGNLLPLAAVRVMGAAAHETLLLDWDGLTDGVDDAGKPKAFPYDSETALKWLTEREYTPFLDAVMYAATVVDTGKREDREAVAGN